MICLLFSVLCTNAQAQRIESEREFSEPAFRLMQNYPNPAKEITHIKFQLNIPGPVTLKLYDMLGNKVDLLVDEYMTSGNHSIPVETANLPNGIYFYVLKKDSLSQTMRMVISK